MKTVITLITAAALLSGCSSFGTTATTAAGKNINVIGLKVTVPFVNKEYSGGLWNDHAAKKMAEIVASPSKK